MPARTILAAMAVTALPFVAAAQEDAPSLEWDTAHDGVAAAVKTYLEGAQAGDSAMLDSVFHESGVMYSLTRDEGGAVVVSNTPFPQFTSGFEEPSSVSYSGEVLDMTLVNDRMASVALEFIGSDAIYRDHLTLLRTDDGWKIVAKAYLVTGMKEREEADG